MNGGTAGSVHLNARLADDLMFDSLQGVALLPLALSAALAPACMGRGWVEKHGPEDRAQGHAPIQV